MYYYFNARYFIHNSTVAGGEGVEEERAQAVTMRSKMPAVLFLKFKSRTSTLKTSSAGTCLV